MYKNSNWNLFINYKWFKLKYNLYQYSQNICEQYEK